MKRVTIAALAALLLAASAEAKVLVTYDITTGAAGYSNLVLDPLVYSTNQVNAVRAILDRFGADYKIYPPTMVKTEFARTGDVVHNFNTPAAYVEHFDAVIHLAFNGSVSSATTGYRPDSLTVFAKLPTVPQLMILEDNVFNGTNTFMANGAADSTWVDSGDAPILPGGGSGNHEGEGTAWLVSNPSLRWFEPIYNCHYRKRTGEPNGGMRVLVAAGMNSVFNSIEKTGLPTANPDSVGTANTDTMVVWEKLNLHKAGSSRVIFVGFGALTGPDSVQTAGAGLFNTIPAANYPALMVAISHLDSISGGLVLGGKKKPGVGFVLTHGGGRSSRMHPGGIFSADTTHMSTSADSIRAWGIPVVIAADPESLAVNAGDIAILKKTGARFTPFVRTGIDTLALGADGGSTATLPRDVWGRYRNRNIGGLSTDTGSVYNGLVASRKALAALVGPERISATLVAPDFDWTPYQIRNGKNANLVDSLLWAARRARFSTIVTLSLGRDSEPAYKTNPVGFESRERVARLTTPSMIGERVTLMSVATFPVWGSSKFIMASSGDTIPPYCDVVCAGPNAAVSMENKFWMGYFTMTGRDTQFNSYDNFSTDQGVVLDSRDRLYAQRRSSILAMPMQSLGGGGVDFGYGHSNNSTTYPGRPGFLAMKHITTAVRAANEAAGRKIWNVQYPEDIEP